MLINSHFGLEKEVLTFKTVALLTFFGYFPFHHRILMQALRQHLHITILIGVINESGIWCFSYVRECIVVCLNLVGETIFLSGLCFCTSNFVGPA